jgi:uncharacterized protein (TIGR00255 family)
LAQRESPASIIASMTGYARVSARQGSRSLTIEITAVNNRFLKLHYRLPDHLQPLRSRFEAAIKEQVARGALTVAVQHDAPETAFGVTFRHDLARHYVETLRAFSREVGLAPPPDLGFLPGLPGVFQDREVAPLPDKDEVAFVMTTLDRALATLVADRRREGRRLVQDVKKRLRGIRSELKAIGKLAPAVVQIFSRRLQERMNEMLAGSGYTARPEDILREVAIQAERVDVTEEIIRLESHLDHLASILREGGECGKRLEFLLQEIHREVNTIGSKAGTTDISPRVVAAKAEVEKIREQIQNLE